MIPRWPVIGSCCVAIAVGGAALRAATLEADALLDGSRVVEVAITLPAEDWEVLRDQSRGPAGLFGAAPPTPFSWYRGSVTVDGVEIADVGVRKKGFFGSLDSERPSLIVDFGRFSKQKPVDGLGRLTLNNNKQDTALVGQFLAFAMFRAAGVPAPRAGFAAVTVNGERLGVYTSVEAVKKPFLERAFGSSAGALYEGTVADVVPESLDKLELETDADARELLDTLSGVLAAEGPVDLAAIERLVAVDEFLGFWAVEALIGMWDGYSSNQNNFFIYVAPADERLHFIPWGPDSSFTRPPGFMGGGNRRAPPAVYAQGAVANRLYFAPGIPGRYRARLEQLLAEVWKEDALLEQVDRLETLLAPHLGPTQANAGRSMEALRGFITRRRGELEKAFEEWPAEAPETYRRPITTRKVGTLQGRFAVTQRADATDEVAPGDVNVSLVLDGDEIALEDVTVTAYPLPLGGQRAMSRGDTSAAPIAVTVSARRPESGTFTATFMLDRRLVRDTTEPVNATGMLTEGAGFFGKGPVRMLGGDVTLDERGVDPGSRIAGSFEFSVDQSQGGFGNSAANRRPDEP